MSRSEKALHEIQTYTHIHKLITTNTDREKKLDRETEKETAPSLLPSVSLFILTMIV